MSVGTLVKIITHRNVKYAIHQELSKTNAHDRIDTSNEKTLLRMIM